MTETTTVRSRRKYGRRGSNVSRARGPEEELEAELIRGPEAQRERRLAGKLTGFHVDKGHYAMQAREHGAGGRRLNG
jgi:hypothetical protein